MLLNSMASSMACRLVYNYTHTDENNWLTLRFIYINTGIIICMFYKGRIQLKKKKILNSQPLSCNPRTRLYGQNRSGGARGSTGEDIV